MSISTELLEQVKQILGVERLPLMWDEKQLDALGVRSVHALRRDRVEGGGIPFVKHKGQVRYKVIDVLQWMQENTVPNTLGRKQCAS
jgi:hypothetical protein